MSRAVMLSFPDFGKPFEFDTHRDASNSQLGDVVSEEGNL